jgi:hypothetical protein
MHVTADVVWLSLEGRVRRCKPFSSAQLTPSLHSRRRGLDISAVDMATVDEQGNSSIYMLSCSTASRS